MKQALYSLLLVMAFFLISSEARSSSIDPEVIRMLKDSGQTNRDGIRVGYWVIYEFDSIDKESIIDSDPVRKKLAEEAPVIITKLCGKYSGGKMNGEWKVFQCYGTKLPLYWSFRENRSFRKGRFHGTIQYYSYTGHLLFEQEYVNGWRDGEYKGYFDNGKLMNKYEFSNDKLNGTGYEYYESGKVRTEINYMKGRRNGSYKTYYPHGKLKSHLVFKSGILWTAKSTYTINGQRLDPGTLFEGIGTLNSYTELGVKISTTSYRYGRREGKTYLYGPTGALSVELNFVNDTLEGPEIEYAGNGTKVYESNISKGKREGKATYYYPNGKPWSCRVYKDDHLANIVFVLDTSGKELDYGTLRDGNGTLKIYDDSSRLTKIITYQNGIRSGISQTFYKSGKLKYENTYENDTLKGIEKLYWENGKLRHIGYIRNGIFSDTLKAWYSNGQLKLIRVYKNGAIWNAILQNDTNGNPVDQGTIRNGNGILLNYSDSGLLSYKYEMSNGYANGHFEAYFSNGKLRKEGTMVNDTLEGTETIYYQNGYPKFVTHFEHGLKNGSSLVYHKNGQAWTERFYLNDLLVNVGFNYDANGKPLDKGTIKDGFGTVNEYDENGKLIKSHEVIGGYVPDWNKD